MHIKEIIVEDLSGSAAMKQVTHIMKDMLSRMNMNQIVTTNEYDKIKKQIFIFQIEASLDKGTKMSLNNLFDEFEKYYEAQGNK